MAKKIEILKEEEIVESKEQCGIIMPISSIDGCSSEHWKEVLSIIKEAIVDANFVPNLVSDADDIGIIQKRIIQNIYNNPIIVCDVSGKNPNVMFELGMRLAFDKATIIIKDDQTSYSFDTSPIEHLEYPRDLRFTKIIQFKELLKEKIIGTYKKSKEDKEYTTFLKHFGEFKIAQLPEKELSSEKYILQSIEELRLDLRQLSVNLRRPNVEQKLIFDEDNEKSLFKAEIMVNQYVNKYLIERKINMEGVDKDNLKIELFKYLEGFEEIKNICGRRKVLENIIERYLRN